MSEKVSRGRVNSFENNIYISGRIDSDVVIEFLERLHRVYFEITKVGGESINVFFNGTGGDISSNIALLNIFRAYKGLNVIGIGIISGVSILPFLGAANKYMFEDAFIDIGNTNEYEIFIKKFCKKIKKKQLLSAKECLEMGLINKIKQEV